MILLLNKKLGKKFKKNNFTFLMWCYSMLDILFQYIKILLQFLHLYNGGFFELYILNDISENK